MVIPVKNEEKYIRRTLEAFVQQEDISDASLNKNLFEILILANNCTDGTTNQIRDFQKQHPHLQLYLEEVTLPPHQANIGYVRRLMLDCAWHRLSQNGGGIIMTTDGDSRVAKDWIAQTQQEIERGAEAVGGRILLCPHEVRNQEEEAFQYYFQDDRYRLLIAELEARMIPKAHNPAPTHYQHFNGSFAVTTDCYARAGGIPDVTFLEDCAFFNRLQAIDARVRLSHQVVVHTSARFAGRAQVGLSYQLNLWKKTANRANTVMVESAASVIGRLRIKKNLLHMWQKKKAHANFYQQFREAAPGYRVSEKLQETFATGSFFGSWYAQVMDLQQREGTTKYAEVPIQEAIAGLELALERLDQSALSHTSIR